MPLYIVTCRGSLFSRAGSVATGGEVEMSAADAASLPTGTVSLKPEQKRHALVPPAVEAQPSIHTPHVVEASRGRKARP